MQTLADTSCANLLSTKNKNRFRNKKSSKRTKLGAHLSAAVASANSLKSLADDDDDALSRQVGGVGGGGLVAMATDSTTTLPNSQTSHQQTASGNLETQASLIN